MNNIVQDFAKYLESLTREQLIEQLDEIRFEEKCDNDITVKEYFERESIYRFYTQDLDLSLAC